MCWDSTWIYCFHVKTENLPSTKCLATHSKMATITTAIGCLIAIWSSFFVLSPRPLQSPCHINSGDELVGSHGPRVSLSSVLAHLWGCSKSCSTIPSSPSGESGVGRSVFLKNSFYRIYDYRRKVPGTVHACVCVCVCWVASVISGSLWSHGL